MFVVFMEEGYDSIIWKIGMGYGGLVFFIYIFDEVKLKKIVNLVIFLSCS